MAPEAQFCVNRHFSTLNIHFSTVNVHFSIANRHFLILNRHFYVFGTSPLQNFETSALRIFNTSALHITHISWWVIETLLPHLFISGQHFMKTKKKIDKYARRPSCNNIMAAN